MGDGDRADIEADIDGLERWAADARAREAAEARVRERWLRTQAEEDAHLSQVLAGLAERRSETVVTTTGGNHVSGRVTALGRDFLALAGPGGRTTLVPLAALAWVRTMSERRRRSGLALGPDPIDPGSPDEHGGAAALADVLAHAAAGRPRVTLHALGATLAGELRAVGADVLVVETSVDPPGLTYVRLQSLSDISLLTSG